MAPDSGPFFRSDLLFLVNQKSIPFTRENERGNDRELSFTKKHLPGICFLLNALNAFKSDMS